MKLFEMAVVSFFFVVYIFYLPRLIIKQDLKSIKLLILEIVLQNIVCVMASDLFGSFITQIIILYKEFVMYGAVITFFVLKKKGKIKRFLLPIIIIIVLCIPYFFIGSATLYTKFICFRQILTPFILILYGSTFRLNKEDINQLLLFIVEVGVFQAVFGLVERFILGDNFWLSMNINKYMEAKGFSAWIFNNGLPGNYYSADLYNYIGMIRRLVGIITDPLLTGHFLAFCVIILLFTDVFNDSIKRIIVLMLCTVCAALTLSKGAMLIIAIGYVFKVWRNNKFLSIILGMIALGIIVFLIHSDVLFTMNRHIGGLTSSLSSEFIIGKGLGSSGNFANLYGGASQTTGESYIGAIIGQMGGIGFITFIYAIINLLKRIMSGNKSSRSYLVFAYIIGVLFEAFFSESAINYVGSGVGLIVFGIIASQINVKIALQ